MQRNLFISSILPLLLLLLIAPAVAQSSKKPLYKNPKASVEDRVSDLMSRMTLEEK
ncbi:MAG: hypothetical protein R2795_22720 [Saprospiraceae bacterium]